MINSAKLTRIFMANMTVQKLDDYCRLHNRVIQKKKIDLSNGRAEQWIVDDSDNYELNVRRGFQWI